MPLEPFPHVMLRLHLNVLLEFYVKDPHKVSHDCDVERKLDIRQ